MRLIYACHLRDMALCCRKWSWLGCMLASDGWWMAPGATGQSGCCCQSKIVNTVTGM